MMPTNKEGLAVRSGELSLYAYTRHSTEKGHMQTPEVFALALLA